MRSLTLVPAGGGCFEVEADGVLLHSKLQTRRFPDPQAMVAAATAHLPKG